MTGQTWAYLAGDTSQFAISLGLETNPHDPDMARPETAASWGSFQLWISGVNVCAHQEQGETIESVHWYILPLVEWFIANWNPFLHEERLPDPDSRTAADMAHSPRVITTQVSGRPAFDWWSWWSRHNIQAGREGGLFPDLMIRRWRDQVEFSWDSQHLPAAPSHYAFLAPSGEYRIDVAAVAEPLYDAVSQTLRQLSIRLPESPIMADLLARHEANRGGLAEQTRLERFAWLTGFPGSSDRFQRLWQVVVQSLQGAPGRLRDAVLAVDDARELFVPGTPQAAMLFGSASPTITDHDVIQISRILINTYSLGAATRGEDLERLRTELVGALTGGRPWEQGYSLAAAALEELGIDTSGAVDVRRIVGRLGITVDAVSLSDGGIRALTLAGPDHVPSMYLNDRYVDGTSEPVQRFSIAHELCHLLLDADRARRLAVTSGPWAPLDVEQRANAFAVAFLLPDIAVETFVANVEEPASLDVVQALAARYDVSMLAVVNHLYNMGLIQRFERDGLLRRIAR
jgi:Zn-dependent peptidase ImmA (M78 family)